MNDKEVKSEPKVYIPFDAKINCSNTEEEPPTVEYEYRKYVYRIDKVKDVTKGDYGKS